MALQWGDQALPVGIYVSDSKPGFRCLPGATPSPILRASFPVERRSFLGCLSSKVCCSAPEMEFPQILVDFFPRKGGCRPDPHLHQGQAFVSRQTVERMPIYLAVSPSHHARFALASPHCSRRLEYVFSFHDDEVDWTHALDALKKAKAQLDDLDLDQDSTQNPPNFFDKVQNPCRCCCCCRCVLSS